MGGLYNSTAESLGMEIVAVETDALEDGYSGREENEVLIYER